MNSRIILYGFIVFAVCLFSHISIWRLGKPRRGSLLLLVIFLVCPAVLLVIMSVGTVRPGSLLFMEYAEIYLLHLSLSSVYISTYPAISAVSPSLNMLLVIWSLKTKGLKEKDIVARCSKKVFIDDKIGALISYSLISEKDGMLRLGFLAKGIIFFFILYRKMLGLQPGKG